MAKLCRLFAAVLFLALSAMSSIASATNYTLWINGRTGGGVVGDYNSFTYWGPSSTAAGINKKSVNWDGYNSISSQNGKIRDALDCFCTGSNWCYVATHSAGDLMMGYTMANYGGSTRTVKNATANASGQCGDAGAGTQVGWNIKWVRAASGAGGGSELSDVGSWSTSEPLVKDLKTTTARAMYNHNETRNVWFYMYAGAKGTFYSGILPGQDDEAVAYHSSGGVSGSAGAAFCNPSDWFCNDLTMGTAANEGGSTKWSYHSVSFRDDAEAYNHYANSNWQGIISVVRTAMVSSAI
ncbi:hypothetical protein LPB67_07890 [Undibacterium sp. Jales W-56]|uniref:hypothetical protein n=1 Tax=Undibacterium sp. Jales W-56 TaxID=2897325 RepID=UPI0021D0A4C2|nr:hypothetical protein [Undibacterium sp. Jales W-56]MCU6433698.1 hypothetical protein [Undibacterium sp. Jales W-56]